MSYVRYEVEYILRVFAVLFMSTTLLFISKDGRLKSSDSSTSGRVLDLTSDMITQTSLLFLPRELPILLMIGVALPSSHGNGET